MGTYFNFYEPVNNPPALTGQVGGTRSSTILEESVGALFARMDTSQIGSLNQYRKFFIKQIADASFSNLEIHLENVEYTGQLAMTLEKNPGDSAEDATTLPNGYAASYFSGHADFPLELGVSSNGSVFGVWLQQTLDEDIPNDDLASFIVQIKGDIT
jgi:hypothetical protein